MWAGRLAWLGHLLDVQKVAGPNPVRPTPDSVCVPRILSWQMHQIVDYATHRKTFAPTKRKYQCLLEDADVRRWHENVSRGFAVTADVYLRRQCSFCQSHDTSPKALIAFNEIEFYNLLLALISSMEKEGHAGSYTESVFKAIRSWLSHNGKDIRRKIKIRGTGDAPSLRDERVPTKEEQANIAFMRQESKSSQCVCCSFRRSY